MKTTKNSNMPIYELINPSDSYTFEAPDLTTAGVVAALLSTKYGARRVDKDEDETTPILFGWDEWLTDRGVDSDWIDDHRDELADSYGSFLIGDFSSREEFNRELQGIPNKDRQEELRKQRHDQLRSSMNNIGDAAFRMADKLRSPKVSQ